MRAFPFPTTIRLCTGDRIIQIRVPKSAAEREDFEMIPSFALIPNGMLTSSGAAQCSDAESLRSPAKKTRSTIELPPEVEDLKQKIIQHHPEKSVRLSLRTLHHVGIPPVDIPPSLAKEPVSVVSGKVVPFTLQSWQKQHHKLAHLRRIEETAFDRTD